MIQHSIEAARLRVWAQRCRDMATTVHPDVRAILLAEAIDSDARAHKLAEEDAPAGAGPPDQLAAI
jgi:hypothetical protein